ncbi:hypothetical protein DPMN_101676 [Dreissena polymorpha]|uniref:Uncharacterized protein n=1 Tax=Dreissena polymorpha TaxID=45954 RepID=A0A9D4LJ78_DREPO|nr:hypothetical protein DPMN_101676 [Dreissena polymorpha]
MAPDGRMDGQRQTNIFPPMARDKEGTQPSSNSTTPAGFPHPHQPTLPKLSFFKPPRNSPIFLSKDGENTHTVVCGIIITRPTVQYILQWINILTKFHKHWMKTVASTVYTNKLLMIFQLFDQMINILTKFHKDWITTVTSTAYTNKLLTDGRTHAHTTDAGHHTVT